ncbi:MAG: hypothetical protein ACFFER_06070 [Candidatus Thorarchaeota archaeon]
MNSDGSGVPPYVEFSPTMNEDAKYVLTSIYEAGLTPVQLNLGMGRHADCTPYLVLDHRTYPGLEANLFTIADSAMWIPEFMPNGNIIMYDPIDPDTHREIGYDTVSDMRADTWGMLLGGIEAVMEWLKPYRERVSKGKRPDVRWAHHEVEWWAGLWEIPEYEPMEVDSFIDHVDKSVRLHIRELNELGFPTDECCSGLERDHKEQRAMLPYVMFDCESYFEVSAHLFTLGNIAGWSCSFGAHGYHVMLDLPYDDVDEGYMKAWDELVGAARKLGPVLESYRELVDESEFTYFAWLRRQRDGAKEVAPEAFRPIEPVFVDEDGNVVEDDDE